MVLDDKIRTWAEIDLGAMVHNLKYAKQLTGGRKVLCVIKGDAHGHGGVPCGRALEKHGADAFAVACLSEGIALREGGIKVPVLLLGWTPAEYAPCMYDYDLTQSVLDGKYACELDNAMKEGRPGKKLNVHIKLDTGMSRTGIYAQDGPDTAAEAIERINALKGLDITGIFTHFAAADMPEKDDYTAWQLENYKAVIKKLDEKGICSGVIHHAANSAGTMYHPETHLDMVRMGVMMYGFYPNGIFEEDGPLRQVLTLKTRVAQVREFPAGTSISYGCTYTSDRPVKIAVAAAGYSDSYPRILSNRGAYGVINGNKCPQVGRICMDMCMFDATGADVRQGDEIILYGRGGMSLEEVAELTGSINCEPTCVLTDRVKRIYIDP